MPLTVYIGVINLNNVKPTCALYCHNYVFDVILDLIQNLIMNAQIRNGISLVSYSYSNPTSILVSRVTFVQGIGINQIHGIKTTSDATIGGI